MKILLIYNSYRYPGGEDTYFYSITSLLEMHGHSVIHFTKSSREITSKVKTGIGMFHNPNIASEVKEIINKQKPDIAQVQNIYPLMNPSIYPLLHSMNIPIVQRISNYRYLCPKMSLFRDGKVCTDCVAKHISYPSVIHACYNDSRLASLGFSLSHALYKSIGAYNRISAFLFPSLFIENYYKRYADIPKEKTTVIKSFYLPEKLQNVDEDEPYIVYVGRLTQEKGIDLLLEVMKELPHIKLIVIGDGPLRNLVVNSVCKNIVYKGGLSTEKSRSYIHKAQFVVMPSKWYDVMPNVLIESFALQKPVVAPKFGVFPELITDNKNGLLYKYNNAKDLSTKIVQLFDNKSQIENLGESAYKTYQQNFTEKMHYEKLKQLYSFLLS